MKLKQRINKIIVDVQKLSTVCYLDYNFKISYLTIFSQSEEDFKELRGELQNLGEEQKANNGYKYKLEKQVNHLGESIDLLRIRKPDLHRKELGCADLTYSDPDYPKLKEIALTNGFDVILRKGYEMIELSDFNINVYAYLVKDI